MNAVGNDFGIGLRFKHIAQCLQTAALGLKVFDNAVMHHGNQFIGNMRVGVGFGNAAMRCPTGVSNACLSAQVLFLCGLAHIGNTPNTAHTLNAVGSMHGNTR